MQDCGLPNRSVDVFASIETLEHVGRNNIVGCIAAMTRAPRHAVILTTPNLLFPKIAHDTQLPIAHWLPASVRRRYAVLFGREDNNVGNDFLTPFDLLPLYRRFRPASRFQTFGSFSEFAHFYPHYLPYGADEHSRYRTVPPRFRRLWVGVTGTLMRQYSWIAAPNLCSIWLTRGGA